MFSSSVKVGLMAVLVALSAVLAAEPIKVVLEFEPNLENGERVFEVCASCHLPEGWGNPDGTYPQLAGQHKNVLMQQLLDIRSGKRENAIMYPFVQERTIGGYQSLADVVAYISTLPMTKDYGRGPWRPGSPEYKEGQANYEKSCKVCHGDKGQGSDGSAYPKLQGQHFNYLVHQAKLIKLGLRESEIMKPMLIPFDTGELARILSYVSYLEPDVVSGDEKNREAP